VKALLLKLTDGVQLPKAFALGHNYPNPFNPTTHFNIEIPKTADVTIAVYDVLGQQVSTLLSGQQNAGYMTVEWDGKDAHGQQSPTGIYFVRMTADEFTATTKIMLMK
jgi:flagellar hook assembly protein FlgD